MSPKLSGYLVNNIFHAASEHKYVDGFVGHLNLSLYFTFSKRHNGGITSNNCKTGVNVNF